VQSDETEELQRQIDEAIARIDAKKAVEAPDPAAETEVPDDADV
jgi:hypothetical protein